MRKVTFMVCEDDSVTRELLAGSLSLLYPDSVVHCAGDGEAGFDLFMEKGADIVITDIDMPVRDGLRMIRDIHAVKPDVQTIVMTAYGERALSESNAADPAQVDHYFRKPVEYIALIEAIDSCIARLGGKSS